MKSAPNTVVSFHYQLSEGGQTLENSRGSDPMVVLLGAGGIIAGLEQAMTGRDAGERFQVTIGPDEAYGQRRENSMQRVPKKYFQNAARLKPGMVTTLNTKDGQRSVTVAKIGATVIDVDLNHPMAGKTLDFDIEIVSVREASAEETAHRHVHGEGGHHH